MPPCLQSDGFSKGERKEIYRHVHIFAVIGRNVYMVKKKRLPDSFFITNPESIKKREEKTKIKTSCITYRYFCLLNNAAYNKEIVINNHLIVFLPSRPNNALLRLYIMKYMNKPRG